MFEIQVLLEDGRWSAEAAGNDPMTRRVFSGMDERKQVRPKGIQPRKRALASLRGNTNNEFKTVSEAEAAIDELRALGGDWAGWRYRVRRIAE